MSDHTSALVPVAASQSNSPDVFFAGETIDIGLFAESLLYYDVVYVHAGNSAHFSQFISKLIQKGLAYSDLVALVRDGTLRFVTTVTVHPYVGRDPFTNEPRIDVVNSFYSLQEDAINETGYFEARYLDTESLRSCFTDLTAFHQSDYERFCVAAGERQSTFGGDLIAQGIVGNAYNDFLDPDRHKKIVRELLEPVYANEGLGAVPDFDVRIREMTSANMDEIARNLRSTVVGRNYENDDYKIFEVDCILPLNGIAEPERIRRIFRTLPLSVAGITDLYIRAAGLLKSDFFLSAPISNFVGDKLYELNRFETAENRQKNQLIIENLEETVMFPDLRSLVNQNLIGIDEVLKIREKARNFRTWLQTTESARDPGLFWSYHNEVATQSALSRAVRKSVSLFGFLFSGVAGAAAGQAISSNPLIAGGTALIAAEVGKQAAKKAVEKLFDYGASIGNDWKPVCFGNWYKKRIEELVDKSES